MKTTSRHLTRLSSSYINKKYKFFGFEEEIDNNNFLPLRITNVDVSIASALKRIFTQEIPTFAFDEKSVKIQTNSSQYHREVLIKRMGYIVIDNIELKKYDYEKTVFSICDENDPYQPLINKTDDILKVTVHKHLYIQEDSTEKRKIDTNLICPYNSLLLTLNPGESIHTLMQVQMGVGRQNPIWQSSITMFKYETERDKSDTIETNEEQMNYIGRENGKKPTSILLTIESVGKLPANVIVVRGILILKTKLETLKNDLILGENTDMIIIEKNENIPNLVKLKITNEDHTLGHVLEAACLNKLRQLIKITIDQLDINEQYDNLEMDLLLETLSAYKNPHPLDNYIELSTRTPQKYDLIFPKGEFDEIDDPTIRMILLAIGDVIKLCDNLMDDTKQFSE